MHFAAKPLVTDLEHVGYINNLTPVDLWFDMVRPHRQFLQSCRSLKQLHMVSLGQGAFNWAAQEKRDMESKPGRISRHVMPYSLQGPRPAYAEHGLVPLEVIHFFGHAESHTDELNDVAFAFSQTLVSIDFHSAGLGTLFPSRPIHFGQGWSTLPRLKRLALIAEEDGRIVVDRALFTHCPNATYVEMEDRTEEYRCQDIVPCLPAGLPNLGTLWLIGWSALTFHPATLSSSSRLTNLKLSTTRRGIRELICFIPPVEELNRSYGLIGYVDPTVEADESVVAGGGQLDPMMITRPHWSWDWHLPHLCALHLTSEFAYRFEFKMLMGCPGLKHLILNMLTEEKQHPRVITQADLFAPSSSSSSNTDSDNDHQSTRIVAGKVSNLRMSGLWIMDDAVLDEFLTFMFPRLRSFRENGWGGITLRGLVRTIRPRVEAFTLLTLSLPQPSSEEEMEELGLYPKDGLVDGGLRCPPQVVFTTGEVYVHYRFKKDMTG